MKALKNIGKAGFFLFISGAALEADVGSPGEWVPYVLVGTGALLMLLYVFIDREYYIGE